MSKFLPNSYQVPNWYTDRYQGLLLPNEWAILTYAMRRIFGFQKRSDRISLSQFSSGVQNKDGEKLDFGTGLSEATCRKYLKRLKKYNLVIEVEPNDSKKNEGALWSLQLDSELVNDDAIMKAFEARNKKVDAKTREGLKAIKAYWEKQKGDNVARNDLTSHETTPLTSHETTPLTSHVTHNKQIKNSRKQDSAAFAAPPPPPEKIANGKNKPQDALKADVSSNGSAPRGKKEPSQHQQLMAAYQDALGYPIPNGAQEGKAAKKILNAGYTIQQVIDCYQSMKKDSFWQGKHLSLVSVHKQLGAFLQAQNGNGRTDCVNDVWQSIKIALGKPGKPDISDRALQAVGMVPGGWRRFKEQDVRFIDQLKPLFEEAYERVTV